MASAARRQIIGGGANKLSAAARPAQGSSLNMQVNQVENVFPFEVDTGGSRNFSVGPHHVADPDFLLRGLI